MLAVAAQPLQLLFWAFATDGIFDQTAGYAAAAWGVMGSTLPAPDSKACLAGQCTLGGGAAFASLRPARLWAWSWVNPGSR